MASNVDSRKLPVWREIINYILLPSITFLLFVTWSLSRIEPQKRIQKPEKNHIDFNAKSSDFKKTQNPKECENSKITKGPEIIASIQVG